MPPVGFERTISAGERPQTYALDRAATATQTIHRTTQFTNYVECGPCPVFERYTLAFALQLRKKHGKTSVRVAGECQLAKNIQYSLIKAFPGSFVVCFLLLLGHAIGFLRWEMGDVVCANTAQHTSMRKNVRCLAGNRNNDLIANHTLHGRLQGLSLPACSAVKMRSLDRSFLGSVWSTPAVDASL
jgi:hypothetical protein